jgi:DNA-directed RNA polymerase specialized sigma24 family protein
VTDGARARTDPIERASYLLWRTGEQAPKAHDTFHERLAAVKEALGAIHKRYSSLLKAIYLEGHSPKELTGRFWGAESTIRGLHRNALRAIRRELGLPADLSLTG